MKDGQKTKEQPPVDLPGCKAYGSTGGAPLAWCRKNRGDWCKNTRGQWCRWRRV